MDTNKLISDLFMHYLAVVTYGLRGVDFITPDELAVLYTSTDATIVATYNRIIKPSTVVVLPPTAIVNVVCNVKA